MDRGRGQHATQGGRYLCGGKVSYAMNWGQREDWQRNSGKGIAWQWEWPVQIHRHMEEQDEYGKWKQFHTKVLCFRTKESGCVRILKRKI